MKIWNELTFAEIASVLEIGRHGIVETARAAAVGGVVRAVPGDEALMTEADRRSGDPWAKQAKEIFAKRRILVDELTSCKGSRPRGIRFLLAYQLVNRAEVHVVRDWRLNADRVRALLRVP